MNREALRTMLGGQQPTVVIDLSRGAIRMATAERAGEAVRFGGITKLELPSASDGGRPEIGDAELAALIRAEVRNRGWRGRPAAILLSGSATSTQSFLFPPMPERDLRRAIELKLDERLHFDLAEAWFDFHCIPRQDEQGREQTLALVVAARRDAVRRALSILRNAGLRPAAVGAASESLANLTYHTSLNPKGGATVHVDIRPESTIVNLFEGRFLRFSREIEVGEDDFTRALMRPILGAGGVLTLSHAEARRLRDVVGYPLEPEVIPEEILGAIDRTELPAGVSIADLRPLVEPVLQRLATELRRSCDYLRGMLERPDIDGVVLSGAGADIPNLDRALTEALGVEVTCSDPVARARAHWRLAIRDEDPPPLADFSAILGFSLGNLRPIDLMPREERFDEQLGRLGARSKAALPAATAVGLLLSLVAIPIGGLFDGARELMLANVSELDRQLDRQANLARRHATAREARQALARAHAPTPDWELALHEVAALLPDELGALQLAGEAREAPTLYLTGSIEAGSEPSSTVVARTATALSESPCFEHARVVKASAPAARTLGRLEVELRVFALEDEVID